ncbi:MULTISPECIES: SDR family NAD(P)-dependent oxidoreductase [Calothrix]|uniref:SDR family oxidoreductase n=2 Tax=Calothrix TaxID=1186 RepID=A0ABR8AMY3_9CYAN|nr:MULTISPECIES: SDR family oxidoreductase [Calothrix]MBD2200036.1 SDR family oxidoreductase [Calothrix parietina FACHB-288]MBD2228909.1 SDR family oxidoreductase [Calothrix anomala FACHB-343]
MSAALITGASSGIGAVFAQELAKQNKNLVLVARSEEKLQQIAATLQAQYPISIQIIKQDLTEADAVNQIFSKLESQQINIDFLVNNAGFGEYGAFTQTQWERNQKMIQLNILALVELTYKFLPSMIRNNYGRIINVASIAAFQPMPYVSVYGATKAFVLSFTEALWAENQNTGVNILALCPGSTKTEFFQEAGWGQYSTNSSAYQNADEPLTVVKIALKAIEQGNSYSVPGNFVNQIIVNIPRLLPRKMTAKFVEQSFRPN